MAQLDPLAGDEVRMTRGRHSNAATFIRYSARGAKAHVFADGTHTTVPAGRISHVNPRSPLERVTALEEPMRVAEVIHRNLGEHRLASEAQETLRAVAEERDHAKSMHAIVHLSYHGHERQSRHLLGMLDEHPPAHVAAHAERVMAGLKGDLTGEHQAQLTRRERETV